MKLYSVCYLKEESRTLMQRTRDECFQCGVWNGPGGKAEPGRVSPGAFCVSTMMRPASISSIP